MDSIDPDAAILMMAVLWPSAIIFVRWAAKNHDKENNHDDH